MSRLYACIISTDPKRDKQALISVARQFAYSIEILEDGILADVSGLERLIGNSDRIAGSILEELKKQNVPGSIAVADSVDTAVLLARHNKGQVYTINAPNAFQKLPLSELPIEQDALNVFNDLGFSRIEDLLSIPREDLTGRYGREFRDVIDVIEQKSTSGLKSNVKEDRISWTYDLDAPVEDFEQLTFLMNHGLGKLFVRIAALGFSTEHLDIFFKLKNRTKKAYEIKTSFPTLEKAFWLKLMNLRISLDPPESEIAAVKVTSYYTRPRPTQRGLYAVSRPEPEQLLLTVNKLKKLVGEDNVGVPVILDRRLAEAFALDADAMPEVENGSGSDWDTAPKGPIVQDRGVIAFSYFHPPLHAEVLVREGRLVFIRTKHFDGRVLEYSGIWKANSRWWDRSWKTHEWDVEIESKGVYRLCKAGKEWFLTGEYD